MRFLSSSLLTIGALFAVTAAGCTDQNGGLAAAPREQLGAAAARQTTSPSPLITGAMRAPTTIDLAGLQTLLGAGHYARTSKLSAGAKDDVHNHRARSVPTFAGSYTLDGQTYPYTMVGSDPRRGGETVIKTTILPVSLMFDGYLDASGNPLVVDPMPYVPQVVTSPSFVRASYGTGHTQFEDAVQRAAFWDVMGKDWHTTLDAPRVQKPLLIEVPYYAAQVVELPDGTLITLLDPDFFNSQLTTLTQLADFHADEVAILFTPNVYLPGGGGVILGFHTAWDAQDPPSNPTPGHAVQTFVWASWIAPGLFGAGFSDVTALSHELGELINDPFLDNITENWAFPYSNGSECQNNLETGDPVEVLGNPGFPVMLGGFMYHPQTEALLQWFTQESPSSAFEGAYSYPDMTALTGPSQTCQ